MKLSAHLEDQKHDNPQAIIDDPRAINKDGAIELCFQLLLSGRKLDEVLAELAANPAGLADETAVSGAAGNAAGEQPAAGSTGFAVAAREERRAAANDVHPDTSPWGMVGRTGESRPGRIVEAWHGVASRQVAALIACGVLIAGGSSAAWWVGRRTAPHPASAIGAGAVVGLTRAAPAAPSAGSKPPATARSPLAQAALGLAAPRAVPASAAPRPAVAGRNAEPARLDLPGSDVAALLARGDALLATGDVTSARLFYLRGAEGRDGAAALRLGETFDPAFLGQAGLPQIAGDATKAVYWYRRARDLGIRDAALLLKQIDPGARR